MMKSHYRQAADQNGQDVEYQERTYDTGPKGESEYTIQNTETVPAKITGEDNISKTDLAVLDIGKLPEDALVLMVENLDVDKNDAFKVDGEVYNIFKIADHYGEGGQKIGQRVLIKPE